MNSSRTTAAPASPLRSGASAPARGSSLDRIARATLFRSLKRMHRGALEIRCPDGLQRLFEGGEPGPRVRIDVHDPRFFSRMLLDGETGAGEAYIRGEWSTDSLVEAVRLGILNRGRLKRGSPLFWIGAVRAWIGHQMRRNTRSRARQNIEAHYDLGNEFFELFLDPSMTYSCAFFLDSGQDLEDAQLTKYRRVARKARLQAGQHLLEIGCGWGGFAEVAAREFGCRVTGITISESQAAYARERMQRAGLEDRVSIELRDYRSLDGLFDRIVSIEMLEAVGHRYLPRFFEACDRVLAPGGRAVVQVITIPDERYGRYRLRPDFIQKFIFPGAHLPSLGAMRRAMRERTRLDVSELEDIAEHYGPTLARWRERLLELRSQVHALGFDDGFVRRWEYYFAYCEAAFRTRYIADLQLVLSRPAEAGA
jgi:cyclopropane-fatty-acyl-phospholipid synthase